MTVIALAVLIAATSTIPSSPSQAAFGGNRSYGLHACDPAVKPPEDSHVFCISALATNRTHRSFGDEVHACHAELNPTGPPLSPKTELSIFLMQGTVADLACQLGNILQIKVGVDPAVEALQLRQVHWRGLVGDAATTPLPTTDGETLFLKLDPDKNTLLLAPTDAKSHP